MSYANISNNKSNKPKGAYSKLANDEESNANPLLDSDGQLQKQNIEQKLKTIQSKLKNLDELHSQIGTHVDNKKFRAKVQETLV